MIFVLQRPLKIYFRLSLVKFDIRMYNPFLLTGKRILVTGASSGIGRSVAIECSKLGATVYLTGRNVKNLEITYNKLEGSDNSIIPVDITSSNDLDYLVGNLPSIDGIVHSAGVSQPTPFPFLNHEKIDYTFDVNFKAPVILSIELVKKKKLNKNSSIVFISSISGFDITSPGGSVYSASKAAVYGMAKGMAIDLANKGIRVNCISPGMVETDILKESGISEEQLTEEKKKYPLKRFAHPDEIAFAAVYLLSDASQWVTGSNLKIDGGYTLL